MRQQATHLSSDDRWSKVRTPTDSYRFDLFALPSGDLLGCDGGTCWRSCDGVAWVQEPALRRVRALASNDLHVWAGGAALQRSIDGGTTWQLIPAPKPPGFESPTITALAVRGDELFLGVSEGGGTYNDEAAYQSFLYRSADAGRTFERLHQGQAEIRAILHLGDDVLFADGAAMLWRRDGTATRVGQGVPASALGRHEGLIFASGAADLYVSHDNAQSFEKANARVSAKSENGDAMSGTACSFHSFVATENALYAASTLGVLRISGDGVAPIGWGLHREVKSLALAHGFLYAHSDEELMRIKLPH